MGKYCECDKRYKALKNGFIAWYNKSYYICRFRTDIKKEIHMQIFYCPFCSEELERE